MRRIALLLFLFVFTASGCTQSSSSRSAALATSATAAPATSASTLFGGTSGGGILTRTPIAPVTFVTGFRQEPDALVFETTDLEVRAMLAPWRVVVKRRSGATVLEGALATGPFPAGGSVGYSVNPTQRRGGGGLGTLVGSEYHSARDVLRWARVGVDRLEVTLSTDEVLGGTPVTVDVSLTFAAADAFTTELTLSDDRGVQGLGESFLLAQGEQLFGLGQHFDSVKNRGHERAMQARVLLTWPFALDEVHVPVPFVMSSRGASLFVEDRHKGVFDVARSTSDRMRYQFRTGSLRSHVTVGADPTVLLERYVTRTGLPPLPPMWAFGHHQWRNKLTNGEQDLLADVAAMRANDIPTSVVWFDAPWMTAYNTFRFNRTQFPDPDRLLSGLAADGFKALVWATEFLDVTDDSSEQVGMEPNTRGDYQYAAQHGYLIDMKIAGQRTPAMLPWWKGWGGNLDFSQPAAVAWWQDNVRRATSKGISGFKLDAGEVVDPIATLDIPIVTGLTLPLYDSKGKITEFGPYRLGYHKAFADLINQDMGGDGMIISRAGCFGDQVNAPFIWPGDLDNGFELHDPPNTIGGLPAAISAGVSVGLVGFPFFAPDIGGFLGGTPTKISLIRWAQFGALCPVMQLGGGGNHRPWESAHWDSETLRIYKKYARLHQDLVPYIYSHAVEAHDTGLPIMRALFLHYPQDPNVYGEDFSYLFGRDLLVAPIYEDTTSREVYLPQGRWIDFWTGTSLQGPQRLTVSAPLDTLPLFVRAGAILPLLAPDVDTLAPATNPSVVTYEQRKDQLRLWVYPEGDTQFTLFDGTSFRSREAANEWTFEIQRAAHTRDLLLRVDWKHRVATHGIPTAVASTQGPLSRRSTRQALDAAGRGFAYDAAAGLLWIRLRAGDERLAVR